jgi:hypothetical protein
MVLLASLSLRDGLPLSDGAYFSCTHLLEALYLVVPRCHSLVPVIYSFSDGTQCLSQR